MRNYEVAVIIDPDVDDRQVAGLLDKHLKVVTDAEGTITNIDVWGRRRMSYDINKKSEGIYAFVTLSATPATVQELDRLMTIDEQIMRTKVMRPEAH